MISTLVPNCTLSDSNLKCGITSVDAKIQEQNAVIDTNLQIAIASLFINPQPGFDFLLSSANFSQTPFPVAPPQAVQPQGNPDGGNVGNGANDSAANTPLNNNFLCFQSVTCLLRMAGWFCTCKQSNQLQDAKPVCESVLFDCLTQFLSLSALLRHCAHQLSGPGHKRRCQQK